jgi:hypothetical protein
VNFTIREAAADGELDLIDVATAFAPVLDELGRERLFFPDAHPRREGYGAYARAVHDGLVELGLGGAAKVGDPFAELRSVAAPAPALSGSFDADGKLTLEVAFEPALEFSILLAGGKSPVDSDDDDWYGMPVALQRDALFDASAKAVELRGIFGEGPTKLQLDAATLDQLGVGPGALFAVLVVRTQDWTTLQASEPVQVR